MPGELRDYAPETLPPAWNALIETTIARGNCLFLLGKVDVGKSTLARTLARESLRRGLATAFLDTDVGQSVVGPPTTLGLKILRRSLDELAESPDALYCIGDVTPRGADSAAIVGTRMLAEVARKRGCDLLIVDSTGFVQGSEAFTLKTLKIENLAPTHLIAIEESPVSALLRPILAAFEVRTNLRICRVFREPGVRSRSQETRREYRESRFDTYFAGGREITYSLKDVTLCGAPLQWESLSADTLTGSLAAFRESDGLTSAIGILRHLDIEGRSLRVFAPSHVSPEARTLQIFNYRF